MRPTLLPLGSDTPPCGDCASTLPGVCCADTRDEIAPTSRPTLVSAASAAVCDSPSTSGTRTCVGPLETSSVTALPTSATVPAGGSVPITRPCAIDALGCDFVA